MSGHGPIFEWSDYDTRILKKALNYLRKLNNIGFEQDEELLGSIQEEIRSRKKK